MDFVNSNHSKNSYMSRDKIANQGRKVQLRVQRELQYKIRWSIELPREYPQTRGVRLPGGHRREAGAAQSTSAENA